MVSSLLFLGLKYLGDIYLIIFVFVSQNEGSHCIMVGSEKFHSLIQIPIYKVYHSDSRSL